ncbi:MAG: hypothetical protein HYS09_10405 [Chloroflexi bacterium]|nr:hypothetical protein [Chloroflexota bacterium]
MSRLDGSGLTQLTPSNQKASFVGIAHQKSASLLYYIARIDGKTYALRKRDLTSDEITTILRIGAPRKSDRPPTGSLRHDGKFLAFHHHDGIDVIRLDTGRIWRVLTNDERGCEGPPGPAHCFGFFGPQWSPDGRLLLAQRIFYEGGDHVIVDPFSEAPDIIDLDPATFAAAWSPSSHAVCHFGMYAAPSGLYLSSGPEWQPRNLLPDYEIEDPDRPLRSLTACAWLDEWRIVFSSSSNGFRPPRSQIKVSDVRTGRISSTATFHDNEQLFTRGVLVVPDGEFVITQFVPPKPDRPDEVTEPNRPVLVNISTGNTTPILQPGDWVVAVIAATP